MDGARDVLDVLLAHVLGAQRELSDDLLVDRGRDADAAVGRDRFEPHRDIDRITHQVVAAFDDVAEIDADAQDELVARAARGIGRAHGFLGLEGGSHRFDGTCELGQKSVPGGLEDAPAMMLHDRSGGGHALAEQLQGMFLVAGRHGAEADDVDGDDRGQPPDQVGFVHLPLDLGAA